MSETVTIKTYGTRMEAEFARSLLEQAGIHAMVTVDDCGGMRPDLAFVSGGVQLLVLEEHVKRATELLNGAEDEAPALP